MKIYTFISFLAFFTFLILACEMESSTSADSGNGSGSEVVGVVENPEQEQIALTKRGIKAVVPVVDGNIYFYKEDFEANPGQNYPPKVYTDSSGRFRIYPVYNGSYILEANNGMGKSIVKKVMVSGQPKVDVRKLQVKNSSSLKYTIKTGFNSDANFSYSIHLLGTRISSKGTGKLLSFQMDDIPTGAPLTVKIKVEKPFKWSKSFRNLEFSPGSVYNLEIEIPEIKM